MLILNAEILKDFTIQVSFEDKTITIDLWPELQKDFWYYEPYRDVKKFQKEFVFDRDHNMIAWGENWNLHFDTPDIWQGNIGKVISDIPVKQNWNVRKYANHFGLTKQAVFYKIWNDKLPNNVKVDKDIKSKEYILVIN